MGEIESGAKNRGYIDEAQVLKGKMIVKRGPGPDRCNGTEVTTYKLVRERLKQVGRRVCESQ